MQELDKHLTNDSVQKYTSSYGKHEFGNKLMFEDMAAYLDEVEKTVPLEIVLMRKKVLKKLPCFKHLEDKDFEGEGLFWRIVYPQMTDIASSCIKATWSRLDPDRRNHNF